MLMKKLKAETAKTKNTFWNFLTFIYLLCLFLCGIFGFLLGGKIL